MKKPSGCCIITIIVIIVICVVCYLNSQKILALMTGKYQQGYSNMAKTQKENMSAVKENYKKNIVDKDAKTKLNKE